MLYHKYNWSSRRKRENGAEEVFEEIRAWDIIKPVKYVNTHI